MKRQIPLSLFRRIKAAAPAPALADSGIGRRVRLKLDLTGWRYAILFSHLSNQTVWVDFSAHGDVRGGETNSPLMWKISIKPPYTDDLIEDGIADFLVSYLQASMSELTPREVLLKIPPRVLRVPPWLRMIQSEDFRNKMPPEDVLFYSALADELYRFDQVFEQEERSLRRRMKSFEMKDLFDEYVGGKSSKTGLAERGTYLTLLKKLKPISWGRAVRELNKALPSRSLA
jgi:hypothetical protein